MQPPIKSFVFAVLALMVIMPVATYAAPPCSYCEENWEWEECWDICVSPIVINLEPGPLRLTGVEEPVSFDINADGQLDTLTWTHPESSVGLLVMDRDGNGLIDNGSELFGEHTPQPPSDIPNGFNALELYDRLEAGGNEDGWISAQDAIFPLLRIWVDANHDGVSQSFELASLGDWQIQAISVSYVETRRGDRHGNWLRWSSLVDFDQGKRLAATDVYFILVD